MSGIMLGRRYREAITGFTGVAVGHCEYLTGCAQTLLQPTSDKTDKRPQAEWFDDQRLSELGTSTVSFDNSSTPGCDIAAPKC